MPVLVHLTEAQLACLANMCAAYSDARKAARRPTSVVDSIAAEVAKHHGVVGDRSTALVYCHQSDVENLRKQANSLLDLRAAQVDDEVKR